MAHYGKEKFEKRDGQSPTSKALTNLYFEEKECRFGTRRFNVMLPRKAFADMILNYPPAGAA